MNRAIIPITVTKKVYDEMVRTGALEKMNLDGDYYVSSVWYTIEEVEKLYPPIKPKKGVDDEQKATDL
jgi:hypothetical protein